MSRFNTIKKSRKRSHEIDEKLNVLNRELKKTKNIGVVLVALVISFQVWGNLIFTLQQQQQHQPQQQQYFFFKKSLEVHWL